MSSVQLDWLSPVAMGRMQGTTFQAQGTACGEAEAGLKENLFGGQQGDQCG